jgi:hypothetical protein
MLAVGRDQKRSRDEAPDSKFSALTTTLRPPEGVMTKRSLIGIIVVAFLAANGLALYAGTMYGRKLEAEDYAAVSGLLEGRFNAFHSEAALAALRRGDQKEVEELLATKLVLSTAAMADILESVTPPDPWFSEQCSAILETDGRVRADNVLDGQPEKDIHLYDQNTRRISDACNRLKASP